jgi:hypothetical protein
MAEKKLNVILDIDETFVQFVGKDDWAQLSVEEQAKYETTDKSKNGFFILRPYINDFFDYLRNNCKTINLWTLSERAYANDVKQMLEQRIPGLKITNAWGIEDEEAANAADYWNPKDLKYIWDELGLFKPCDTLLIDDLPRNTLNDSNKLNGIRLPPFDPLGEKMEKSSPCFGPTRIRNVKGSDVKKPNGTIVRKYSHYSDMSEDRGLLNVIKLLEGILPSLCLKGYTVPVLENMKTKGGRKTRRRKPIRKSRKTKTRR